MRKKLRLTLTLSILGLGIATFVPTPSPSAYGFFAPFGKRTVVEEVKIPVEPNVYLTGKIYQRKDLKQPQPTLIFIAPWSVGIWVYDRKAKDLAEQGYVVLAYNSRGWSGSQGEVDGGGPTDVADAARLVDWISQNPRVDRERIGMAGISLGAGTALMAAANDARIRAVVSFSGWSDLYTSTFGNETKRTLWNRILNLAAQVTGGKIGGGILTDTYIDQREFEKIKDYTDPRSPIHLVDQLRDHQTAIFISQNYSDFLFPVSDMWKLFEKLETPKRIRLQPGIHASAEVLELFLDSDGDLWRDAQAWLDFWVKDRGTEGLRRQTVPQIQVTIQGEKNDLQFDSKDDLNVQQERFYLSPGRGRSFDKLIAVPEAAASVHTIDFSTVSGVNAGIPIIYPLIDSLQPIDTAMSARRIRLDRAAVYEWGPVKEAVKVLGIPRLHLKIESNQPMAQVVAYLYQVTPRDEWKLISIAPYTVYDFVPGQPKILDFDLFNGFASLKRGEKLVLAFDTFDPEFAPLDLKNYQLKIHADGESFIDLPLTNRP